MENQNQNLRIKISEVEKIANKFDKNHLFQIIDELKELIINNIKDKIEYQNVIDKISSIISLLNEIFEKKIQKLIEQYESIMKRDEQTIRILYKSLLTYKLLKDSLDNRIRLLLIKEKEYELIKDKTGAYIRDGEIIYNKQKDNEIIILRTENSNLKNLVENYEKIISDKDLLYENLKNKYNFIQNELNKNKTKKLSIPNININLNDSPSLTNIDNNKYYCSINLNNSKKPLNISDKKNSKNFNYLKYKKINKNIPFNNCLSSKNMLHSSVFVLNPKDIFGIKNNNSKSNSNKKNKKAKFEKLKDICALKKKNIKLENAFHNHFKKNQFNLLQAYTANSSKSLNKSPISKKESNYSNDIKISSYHTKKNYSQKIIYSNNNRDNTNKKSNICFEDSEKLYKSYISNIPFKKENCNINQVRKEIKNKNNFHLIYCKTKRENYSKKIYKKINNKKLINIDTNKIFLPSNIKKNGTKSKNNIK